MYAIRSYYGTSNAGSSSPLANRRRSSSVSSCVMTSYSIHYTKLYDMAQITMRGVGVDISTMDAEPGVAFYSDGTYRGGLTSSSSLFFRNNFV